MAMQASVAALGALIGACSVSGGGERGGGDAEASAGGEVQSTARPQLPAAGALFLLGQHYALGIGLEDGADLVEVQLYITLLDR